ncbi:MAG: EutN/CcmL family microcompartment protein [Candidatus Hodarchaeales archaeon]|jgi:microcompartment protein CcmK/EutM
MILARVIGNVVATIKTRSHENWKLLIVEPIDTNGNTTESSIIAIDVAKAGVGDCVLVIREGNSIRSIMHDDQGAVDALVIGVVDYIEVDGKQKDLY